MLSPFWILKVSGVCRGSAYRAGTPLPLTTTLLVARPYLAHFEARYRNGVLEVRVPKGELARSKHIPVRTT